MSGNLLDPVVLCFVAGLLAGIFRSDLRFPEAGYEVLSIYLLLAIGLKGGVQVAGTDAATIAGPLAGTLLLGVAIPLVAFAVLRTRFSRPDAAALAAHYGSVSAVTFAVALGYLAAKGEPFEEFVTVLLVALEVPAIAVGVLLARLDRTRGPVRWGPLLHEVLLGRSVYLLVAGLAVGAAAGPARVAPIAPVFFDLFKGALALFLLQMGVIASRRLADLRTAGPFLAAFAVAMPLASGALATGVGLLAGLSPGGTTVLATLAGSASYIAAPAAMRFAIPEANPSLYLTASLGITFPFNLVVGIPVYHWMATTAFSWSTP